MRMFGVRHHLGDDKGAAPWSQGFTRHPHHAVGIMILRSYAGKATAEAHHERKMASACSSMPNTGYVLFAAAVSWIMRCYLTM